MKSIAQSHVGEVISGLCQDMTARLYELGPIPVEGRAHEAWVLNLPDGDRSTYSILMAERKMYQDLTTAFAAARWKTVLMLLTKQPWGEQSPGPLRRAQFEPLQAVRNAWQERKDAVLRETVRQYEAFTKS